MRRMYLALLCGLLMLVGCSANVPAAAPPAASDTAQFSATATPQLALVTTRTPDTDGVWRSPLDTMPILPGDPRTAPMPNAAGPLFGPTP